MNHFGVYRRWRTARRSRPGSGGGVCFDESRFEVDGKVVAERDASIKIAGACNVQEV